MKKAVLYRVGIPVWVLATVQGETEGFFSVTLSSGQPPKAACSQMSLVSVVSVALMLRQPRSDQGLHWTALGTCCTG